MSLMRTPLESEFQSMDIQDHQNHIAFYPRKGSEKLEGSPTHKFYVVTAGRIPGIYTHWHDVVPMVSGFPNAAYKKHSGWSEAVHAWDASRRPDRLNVPATSASRIPLSTPVTRARGTHAAPSMPRRRAEPDGRTQTVTPPGTHLPSSAPSTPTGMRPLLYVCSGSDHTTIYADRQAASSSMWRALADGSFRKVEVTSRVRDAFDHAEESVLQVYDISSSDEE